MSFWTTSLNVPNTDIAPKLKDRFLIIFGGTDSDYAQNILLTAKSVTKPSVSIETKEYQLINHKFKYPGIATWQPIKITFVDMAGTRTKDGIHRNSSKKFGKRLTDKQIYEQIAERADVGFDADAVEGILTSDSVTSQSSRAVLGDLFDEIRGSSDAVSARNAQHTADFLDDILQRSGYDRPTYHPGNTSPRKAMMNYYLSGIRIQQIDTTQNEDGSLHITEEWELMNPIIKSISWGDLAYGDSDLVEYTLELDYDYATFRYGTDIQSLEIRSGD